MREIDKREERDMEWATIQRMERQGRREERRELLESNIVDNN
jgi:hypothetical protein